jgi:secreted PhoX family phosphatase
MPLRKPYPVTWIDLDDPEAPKDDLRLRAAAKGATLIARGEGLHMGVNRGQSEVFACCTSGGAKELGQILKLSPGNAGAPDQIELYFESENTDQFNFGDNLTVAPNGHLIVCEDQYTPIVDNHIRGISPDGQAYTVARLTAQTELAGGCFSPDGKVLFVNAYDPTATLAITGPWAA